jgi:hypothetical protein
MSGPGGVSGFRRVFGQPRRVPLGSAPVRGHLVPVTRWVHPDVPDPAQPYRAVGRDGSGRRDPYLLLGTVVVGVTVVATLAACLVIALVAWVSAHAVAVGVGIAAVVATALVFLRALTRARTAGPPGWCGR